MTTRCFHIALLTDESDTRLSQGNAPGAGYALVSPGSGQSLIWSLLAAILPAPLAASAVLRSNAILEPEWVVEPTVHVASAAPTGGDGIDGDVWIEY